MTSFASLAMTRVQDHRCSPPVARGLQPGLRGGGALLPAYDIVHVLEREPDVVEAFEEPHAIGRRNIEGNVVAARSADALGLEIDGERRRAVGGDDARREGIHLARRQNDWKQGDMK